MRDAGAVMHDGIANVPGIPGATRNFTYLVRGPLCEGVNMCVIWSLFQDTALHVAVKNGNKVMLKELLKRWTSNNKKFKKLTAGIDQNEHKNVIFGANKEGENPLTIAIKANERWVLETSVINWYSQIQHYTARNTSIATTKSDD